MQRLEQLALAQCAKSPSVARRPVGERWLKTGNPYPDTEMALCRCSLGIRQHHFSLHDILAEDLASLVQAMHQLA